MPRQRRKPPVSARIGALVTDAMEREHVNAHELGVSTGLGAATIGRLSRGQSKAVTPSQAMALVRHLPISMADILEAMGYPVATAGVDRIPEQLVDAWPRLSPAVQVPLLQLALAVAGERPMD